LTMATVVVRAYRDAMRGRCRRKARIPVDVLAKSVQQLNDCDNSARGRPGLHVYIVSILSAQYVALVFSHGCSTGDPVSGWQQSGYILY